VGHYADLNGNVVPKYAEGNCIGTLFFGVDIRAEEAVPIPESLRSGLMRFTESE